MKTGTKCKVCTHEDRDAIEDKIISGLSMRNIAEQYGISKTAVHQHRTNHLPAKLVKAKQLQEVDSATELIEKISDLYQRAYMMIDGAEKNKSFTGAASLIREARNALELLAKISGDLKTGTHLTLIYSPQWISLRQTIVKTLDKFPEARQAVIEVLEEADYDEIIG